MSELDITQDTDVAVITELEDETVVVLLDSETEIIQTMEQGPPGPVGPQGPMGLPSDVAGPVGPMGPPGAQGPAGPASFPDAPADTNLYGRKSATVGGQMAWSVVSGGGTGGGSTVYVGTNPPTGVPDNSLFWESDTGLLYILYNDGTSTAWVQAAATVAGPAGPTGQTGLKGDQGPQGNQGPSGAQGPPGPASTVPGPVGPAGPTGPKGDQGLQGLTGEQGVPGPTGPVGPQGIIAEAPLDGLIYGRSMSAWTEVAAGGASVTVSDTPPPNPNDGDLWFESDSLVMFVYYDDGSSAQWVVANPLSGAAAGPSNAQPAMDGVGAPGLAIAYARGDHVHPSDSTKYDASNPAGYATAAQITGTIPQPATANPLMDATAAVGVSVKFAREDHVHPSDTTRASVASLAAYAPLASPSFTGAAFAPTMTINTLTLGALQNNGNEITNGSVTVQGALKVNGFGSYVSSNGSFNPQAALCVGSVSGVGFIGLATIAAAVANYQAQCARIDRTDCWLQWWTWGASTGVGSVTTNGSSVAYNTTSDYRLKVDFGEIAPLAIGAMIDAVPVHDAEWKAAAEIRAVESTRTFEYRYPMFLAHEVAAACPWAVVGDKDEVDENGDMRPQQMDASKLVAVLWAEVRNLRARLAEVEAKLA